MTEPLGQMIIELGLDSSSFGKGLAGVRKETKYAMSEMKSNMAVLGQTGNALDKLGAKQTGLTKVLAAQKREVAELKKAYEGSFVNGKPTAQTAKLATQLQNANAKVAGLNSQLINNARQMAITETRTQGWTGHLNKMSAAAVKNGKTMTSMGAAASKYVSIPLGAAMLGSVKAASDFDSAFTGVKKTVDEAKDSNGKTIISYKDLENGIRSMAKSIPVSTTEISHVAEAAGQLGIKTKNVLSFTKTMVAMGKATNMSSEDASVALAKLANITGMPQKNFDRLGSSIVNLGNNMATTESDIVEMSLRLAGSGHQVGMTEAQITGLAAAMSSVGINAEAGGGSMSRVMQKINTSVMSGNKSLSKFASISGMSSKEFQKAWKDDASQAIVSFVKGLGKAKTSGKDVTSMLKSMGISSTQELDTMLRLSGAGDTLSKSLKISGQGWKENTALTQEAEKRYATFESKLQIVKNKLTDVGITVGGPLMSAFSDAIDAAEPAINTVERLSKAFSDADPKTQSMLINMGLLAVAGGPVLGIVGKLTTSVGTLGRGFVDLVGNIRGGQAAAEMTSSLLGKVGADSMTAAGGISKMGPATLEASENAGLLAFKMGAAGEASTGLAAAIGPVGLAILGTTAVVGLGVAAWELWGKSAVQSAERTARWGTDVGAAADQSLSKMQNFSSDVQNQLEGFASKSQSSTKAVAANFNGMFKQLEKDSKQSFKKMQKDIDDLPAFAKAAAEKDLAEKKATNAKVVADAKAQNKTVQTLLKQHNGDVSKLSADEKQIVLNARTRITADELKLLQIGGKAKKVVLETLNGDVSKLSRQHREQDIQDLSEQYTKEKKIYENQADSIKKAYKDGAISADTYKKSMKELESNHKSSVDNMAAATLKLDRANGKSKDEIMQDLGVYETSYKRAAEIVDGQTKKMSKSTSLIAADTNSMSKATAKANEQWNSLIFDPKTGKVKTNAQEEVNKAAQSKEGWAGLKYDLKHANLSSNAKLMIGEAVLANGKWDDLTWKEQQAIVAVKGNKEMADIIQQFGIWNQFTPQQKNAILHGDASPIANLLLKGGQWNMLSLKEQQALVKDKATVPLVNILDKYGVWQGLSETQKNAILTTKGAPALADLVIKYGAWNDLPQKQKNLLVNNADARQKLIDAGVLVDKYKINNPPSKALKAHDGGLAGAVIAGNNQINSIKRNNPPSKALKGHDAGLGGAVSRGNSQVNGFKGNNPASKGLKAHDSGLGSAVSNANAMVDNFKRNNPKLKNLKAKDNASGPASSASNSVDNFSRKRDHTVTLTSIFKTITKKITGKRMGTDYHTGGPMMVNDQAGPTFRELIQRPNGFSFIPEGRNVILPDEPIGTKVITASRTNRLLGGIPQFANGTAGIPADAQILKNIDQAQSALTNQTINISGGNNDEVVRNQEVQIKIQQSQLDIMHTLLNVLTSQEPNNSGLDLKQLAQMINETNAQSKNMLRYNNG
ncbi:phage tail tape measure protein [Latilactobacillus curvatus]|uniref:phage tail tape measure protein n=1 Tax=Latilactobacillus curvatus TaxID=28038 RepID=UPI0008151F61|nr:phage tail tape measure protein [Latilactobacillus curvatus]ANY14191.1 phage tail tape measure protein [Latilactobacillus curvatus]